jgi:hypothetical protein
MTPQSTTTIPFSYLRKMSKPWRILWLSNELPELLALLHQEICRRMVSNMG